ncbi:unnamed protein product [Thlaspi arvense]|uniref:Phorbol-ester/DAG-type domain-containing protein n=1 Tax=Thlaspi arvense TaxID=13288 RepID=A0AAU9RKR9_THLAR|nr:unnamed protein product [Thlaspi arvense]
MDKVLFSRHGHGLSFAYNEDGLKCDACDGSFRAGRYCDGCKFTIHMRCVFLLYIKDKALKHPSHVGHRLKLLTTGAPVHTDPRCHLCGKNTKRLLYRCSTCKLNLDIDCMLDALCGQAHVNMPWHPHPLLRLTFRDLVQCEACHRIQEDGYFCPRCRMAVHEDCVSVFESPEITHPSHVRHNLKLLTDGAPDYTDKTCHVCGDHSENLLYHCDICKFNLDLYCAIKEPRPFALLDTKVHEHTLTLMPKLISFVCDACGRTKGEGAPYVCLQCDSMIFHQDCTQLPRVINVNRHHHRVTYTYPLGHRGLKCGVCLEAIDWSYGAYSCSHCPNHAYHSRCATREDVWDGEELDGVAEEVEDIEPFKVNDDNTITHVAHDEHNMSLNEEGIALEESILCEACVGPIGSNTFYYCSTSDDCSFILHETCASLPKIKRHFLSPKPLSLDFYSRGDADKCHACRQGCCDDGFMYSGENHNSFDLLCSSITDPLTHGSHPHPLFFLELPSYGDLKKCRGCGMDAQGAALGCSKCDFYLDFRCATLPLTVRLHRYDDHPLTLCYGEEASSGKYWCDVCERETNRETWFYTCYDCGVTLHDLCVLGDIRYAKAGGKFDNQVDFLPNDTSSRPLCETCGCRCPGRFILDDCGDQILCSLYCFILARGWKDYWCKLRCPPWALALQYIVD